MAKHFIRDPARKISGTATPDGLAACGATRSASGPGRLLIIVAVAFASAAAIDAGVTMVSAWTSGQASGWPDASLPLSSRSRFILMMLAAVFLGEWFIGGRSARALLDGSRSSRTDIWYMALALVNLNDVALVASTLGAALWLGEALGNLNGFGLAAHLPVWAGAPAAFLTISFCKYWLHRMMHLPLFWPLHAVHHSGEEFTVATSFRVHPLEVLPSMAIGLIVGPIGFTADAVMLSGLCFTAQSLYAHSHLPSHPWLERWGSFGPRLHGLHHSADPRHFNRNFGELVIWDRLFGTYIEGAGVEGAGLGRAGDPVVMGTGEDRHLYVETHPLLAMAAIEWRWLKQLVAMSRTGTLPPPRTIAG